MPNRETGGPGEVKERFRVSERLKEAKREVYTSPGRLKEAKREVYTPPGIP